MEFRRIKRTEVEQIWTIDRREYIERIYHLEDGRLVLQRHEFDVPGWHPDNVSSTTPLLYEIFDRGGDFFAAFDWEQLAGIAVLDTIWRAERGDLLQLEFLHVGRDYRGQGLGVRLFEQARNAARDRAARCTSPRHQRSTPWTSTSGVEPT